MFWINSRYKCFCTSFIVFFSLVISFVFFCHTNFISFIFGCLNIKNEMISCLLPYRQIYHVKLKGMMMNRNYDTWSFNAIFRTKKNSHQIFSCSIHKIERKELLIFGENKKKEKKIRWNGAPRSNRLIEWNGNVLVGGMNFVFNFFFVFHLWLMKFNNFIIALINFFTARHVFFVTDFLKNENKRLNFSQSFRKKGK